MSAVCSVTPRFRDGAAKRKVERFFRSVRDKLLIRQLDLSWVDALNRELSLWAGWMES